MLSIGKCRDLDYYEREVIAAGRTTSPSPGRRPDAGSDDWPPPTG
jgi:hypothetical protein